MRRAYVLRLTFFILSSKLQLLRYMSTNYQISVISSESTDVIN